MLVVDVETTGTDPRKHSILSIGAVDFSNPQNEFYEECAAFPEAHVADDALEVNGRPKDKVFDPTLKSEAEIVKDFLAWMAKSPDHTFMGQNPSFDISFIRAAAERAHIDASIPHRSIDLHSLCFAHMEKRGVPFPLKNNRSDLNSDKIMEYVGIPPEVRPHIAINGARIEAEAFSRLLYNKSFYSHYSSYKIPWL